MSENKKIVVSPQENEELRLFINEYDVTGFFTSIEWSGTKSEVARKLTFSRLYSDAKHVPTPEVGMHDMVQLYWNYEEIFRGYIVSLEQTLGAYTIPFVCYDGGFFLANNEISMNIENEKPEEIVKKACKEVNVPVGETLPGEPYERVHDNDSVYDVIMTGYTLSSHTDGIQYCLEMEQGAVNVRKKGDIVYQYQLSGERDIYEATFATSSENAVNRVKLYGESGDSEGTVELENFKDFAGILQKVHKGSKEEAKAMLQDFEMTASVESIGRVDCRTNRAVVVKEPVSGLSGLFYIDSDTHTWEGGVHTMSLELAFENVMDEVLAGNEEQEEEEDFDAVPGDSNAARAWNYLRSRGYSSAATAGILGNLEAESGIDPKILQNGRGPGTGVAQWENPGRWPLLVSWAKGKGKDPWALETQLAFLVYELEGGEVTTASILNSRFGGLSKFKSASDPKWATDAFYQSFERGSIHRMEARYNAAKKYFNQWKDYKKVPSGKAGGGSVPSALMNAIHSTPFPGSNLCATWVSRVFQRAYGYYPGGNGNDMTRRWCHSTDLSKLRPGMVIGCIVSPYGTAGRMYGHIAIYAGNDTVYSSEVGGIRKYTVNNFITTYGPASGGSQVKWGWMNNQPLS